MSALNEAEELVKELGLTEYQAKAFIALVKFGTLPAERIGRLGKIPLPRIYDTLEDLQKKGLVMISRGRPKMYKLVDPKISLKNFIKEKEMDFAGKLKEKSKAADKLAKILEIIGTKEIVREEKWNIWHIERKVVSDSLLKNIKSEAKKEVIIFSGDLSWLKESRTIMKSVVKKGVKVRVVVRSYKTGSQTEKNVELAKSLGIEVKTGYTGDMRGDIIDGRLAAIIYKKSISGSDPDTGRPGDDINFSYELMTLDNSIIVSVLKENFNFWWGKLKNV